MNDSICQCGKPYNSDECYGYCHICIDSWFANGCQTTIGDE